MIYYVVTRPHTYTVRTFLEAWGRSLLGRVQVLRYDELPTATRLPAGTYIFTDFERLAADQRALAAALAEQLAASGRARVLNQPAKFRSRYELLRELHRRGASAFNVYRLREEDEPQRYPVFIRHENDHAGSMTDLLRTPDELHAAVADLRARRAPLEELVVTEFCDTVDARGVYHKYGAFRVGDRILPRHLLFGRKWVLKYSEGVDEATLAAEAAYLATNPHERELLAAFDAAGLDYGRADYALLDGRVQVWEINSNPDVIWGPLDIEPQRLATQAETCRRLVAAFEAIDTVDGGAPAIPVRLERGLARRLGVGPRQRLLKTLGRAALGIEGVPPIRWLTRAVRRSYELGRR